MLYRVCSMEFGDNEFAYYITTPESVSPANPAITPNLANSASPPYHSVSPSNRNRHLSIKKTASVVITEQPASKALRFRYECEGRSAGSVPGTRSTAENKTYPSISVLGYQGSAVVVVSCVTKEAPFRPHPHNLVGKDGCKKGVCTLNISEESMSVSFSNLGIQCVKKKDIEASLLLRESLKVDPFKTGFSHRLQPTSIDLNAVRLCFQVFVEGAEPSKYTVPLDPVVSEPIYDKKSMCDLCICRISDTIAPVTGGKDIIILCDKVSKDDIEVRFFQIRDGQLVWEGFGDFQTNDVHKQVAIAFRTPKYSDITITEPVVLQVELRRPSDKLTSEPRNFTFIPSKVHPDIGCVAMATTCSTLPLSVIQYIKSEFVSPYMTYQQQPQQDTGARAGTSLEQQQQSPCGAHSPQLELDHTRLTSADLHMLSASTEFSQSANVNGNLSQTLSQTLNFFEDTNQMALASRIVSAATTACPEEPAAQEECKIGLHEPNTQSDDVHMHSMVLNSIPEFDYFNQHLLPHK